MPPDSPPQETLIAFTHSGLLPQVKNPTVDRTLTRRHLDITLGQ